MAYYLQSSKKKAIFAKVSCTAIIQGNLMISRDALPLKLEV